jgi:NTE family protein
MAAMSTHLPATRGPSLPRSLGHPTIGLALGGGGARGFGHIPVIEAFDELGLKVSALSGTSIGAIFAAGYAAGNDGKAMREMALGLFANRATALSKLWQLRPKSMSDLWNGKGLGLGQLEPERILDAFVPDAIPRDFADLKCPLAVVSTDFYGWGAHVSTAGPLRPAVAASMAIPVIFKPVSLDGRVLVDGGVVNPVPVDVLPKTDLVVAVDVIAYPESSDPKRIPSATEAIFGATQLLMQAVVKEKLIQRPPDLLVRPEVHGFAVLDFLRAKEILAATGPIKDTVKRRLERLLSASPGETMA